MSKISPATISGNSASPVVDAVIRIGAAVALRELKSPLVADFLQDQDPWVVTEAARSIHDDLSIPEALPALAQALERVAIKEEAFVRRAINANLRLGKDENAQRLVAFATNPEVAPEMRADALWALGYWGNPPVLDRVEGRFRELPKGNRADAQNELNNHLSSLMNGRNPLLKTSAVQAIGRLELKGKEAAVFAILNNKREPSEARIAALITLGQLGSSQIDEALRLALADKDGKLRETAQSQLGELELEPETVVALLGQVLKSGGVTERQKALASLGKIESPAAEKLLGEWVNHLEVLVPELQLDVLMAVESSQFENLKTKKATYEARKKEEGLLSEFDVTLKGGDSDRGRRIFYRNNSAQCIRCHRIQGNGGEVGPELTHIASAISREEILTSLIDPSARIAPGYGTVEVILKDDVKVIGILEKVSNTSITLNPPSGEPLEIKLKDIKERKNYPSGMFSMKDVISKEEIRDLVAYLAELK